MGGRQPEGVLLQPRPAAPVPSQVEVDVVADVASIILLSYIRAVNEPSQSFIVPSPYTRFLSSENNF